MLTSLRNSHQYFCNSTPLGSVCDVCCGEIEHTSSSVAVSYSDNGKQKVRRRHIPCCNKAERLARDFEDGLISQEEFNQGLPGMA